MSQEKLRLAIQKSGRLSSPSVQLLNECGIKFSQGSGVLKSAAFNFPVEIFFLRQEDIPTFVRNGSVDLGIIGEDILDEVPAEFEVVRELNIAKCSRCIAFPRDSNIDSIKDIEGKSIATCYPRKLKELLRVKKINANVVEVSPGSVAVSHTIGLADMIYDIMVTGTTISSNGLQILEESIELCKTKLISNKNLSSTKMEVLGKFTLRIDSVISAKDNKYIVLNAPKESVRDISVLLPGMQAPTVIPLNIPGWVAVHAVIGEGEFWDNIDKLKKAGASDILVIPIDKMIIFPNSN